VTLRSRIRHPATLDRPIDNIRGLIRDICLIWEQDRLLFRKVMTLGEVDPEVREIIENRQEDRSAAIDAISHRLIARYQRRATVEALWALTSFPVFDSIRRPPHSRRPWRCFRGWRPQSLIQSRCGRFPGETGLCPDEQLLQRLRATQRPRTSRVVTT
jgi:hypothetical protein